ncbi:ATP-binding protein [bacterium]|nr:ATP-binding protein [bacterium]
MAFPEIAYPEPGWVSRFVGRTEQFKIIESIIDSTDRGTVLPIIQVIGESGVGKSWFIQKLRWRLRNSINAPSLLMRFSNPAMAQTDRSADAIMSRLINRWKMNLRLTEFVLGRIAHLKDENIDRFTTYSSALKILPSLKSHKGESELRRILIERGVDKLEKLWGNGWGRRFLAMSPKELSWYLPELLGIDIDSAMRTLRFKTFVLLVDDADRIPELYYNALRLKFHSSLTLLVTASRKACPTAKHSVETIPLEPLPVLERRAYFYLLGIDKHKRQEKIVKKHGSTSIGYAIGAVESKQILERNPSLKNLLGTLLVCHRPSLDIIYEMLGDMGTITSFFAESSLVDLLEHPDRFPRRFTLHSSAREWVLNIIKSLPKPEQPYGEIINRLALFAHRDFSMGIPVIYWFFRNSIIEGNYGDGADAISAADEIAKNIGKSTFNQYNRYLLLRAFCPDFSKKEIYRYARQRILWQNDGISIPDLLVAGQCFNKIGRHLFALWTARGVLPKISEKLMENGAKDGVYMLFRSEANRIIGEALYKLGKFNDSILALTKARESVRSVSLVESALVDEVTIQQIKIFKALYRTQLSTDDRTSAWDSIKKAIDLSASFLSGVGYKIVPTLIQIGELLDELFKDELWNYDIIKSKKWLERTISNCHRQRKEKENKIIAAVEVKLLLHLSELSLDLNKHDEIFDYLNDVDKLIKILGEKMRWGAEIWRKYFVESKLILAESYAAQAKTARTFESVQQAQDTIVRWAMDEESDTIPLAVKSRIIGGLALSRMERFDDALVWLNSGVSIAEVASSKGQVENPVQIHILCGDAYHELARIESHRQNRHKARQMAQKGIEHIMEIISTSDSVDLRFNLTKMYMFLLQTTTDDFQETIEILDSSSAMLIAGCHMERNRSEQCSRLAEELFEFALKIIPTADEPSSERIAISALSLYPFLKKQSIIRKAHILADSIDKGNLSNDLLARFTNINELINNFKSTESED